MEEIAKTFTKKELFVVLGVGTVSGALIGATVTQMLLKKKLETKYAEIARAEIEEAKAWYSRIYKAEEFATPEAAAAALLPDGIAAVEVTGETEMLSNAVTAIRDYRGDAKESKDAEVTEEELGEPTQPSVTVVNNIFTNPPEDPEDNFNYEAEMRNRTEDAPYVITNEEYFANEKEYEQVSVTYYEGDDVLVDAQEMPIDETDKTVGDYNLQRFGHGSKDPNIVYVRNEVLETEFEIAKSTGSYADEVLGFQHSQPRPTMRKFRRGDDE